MKSKKNRIIVLFGSLLLKSLRTKDLFCNRLLSFPFASSSSQSFLRKAFKVKLFRRKSRFSADSSKVSSFNSLFSFVLMAWKAMKIYFAKNQKHYHEKATRKSTLKETLLGSKRREENISGHNPSENFKRMRLIRDIVTWKCDAHFSSFQPFNV